MEVVKRVVLEGGISILVGLVRFWNWWVVEEVVGGLWNLLVGEEYKVRCCGW